MGFSHKPTKTMIELARHPIIQDITDHWRLELPVVAQLDETQLTKEHLRLLIQTLINVLEEHFAMSHSPTFQRGESVNNKTTKSEITNPKSTIAS